MRIEQWGFSLKAKPYEAPELAKTVLVGYVYGNLKFPDGTFVTTSRVREIDLQNMKIKTSNSEYELGEMAPSFKDYMERNGFTLELYASRIGTNIKRNQEGE